MHGTFVESMAICCSAQPCCAATGAAFSEASVWHVDAYRSRERTPPAQYRASCVVPSQFRLGRSFALHAIARVPDPHDNVRRCGCTVTDPLSVEVLFNVVLRQATDNRRHPRHRCSPDTCLSPSTGIDHRPRCQVRRSCSLHEDGSG